MAFFTPKPPPIITGTPIPYPNIAARPASNSQVLLFDEADAIFGKRTEVQSHWHA